jgi:hypothetical protein
VIKVSVTSSVTFPCVSVVRINFGMPMSVSR